MASKRLSLRDGSALEVRLRGITYMQGEHQLSVADSERVSFSLTLWLLSIGDIAPRYGLERSFSMANLVRWPGQAEIDVSRLLSETKDCLAVLRDVDPLMGPQRFRSFRSWLRSRLSGNSVFEFLKPLFYKLYQPSISLFSDLNTILQFWSRLTLRDADWQDEAVIDSYLTLEHEMQHWVYPSTTIDCLRHIVTHWLSAFQIDGLAPDFSNGATAETRRGAGIVAKSRCGFNPDLLAASAMLSYDCPYFRMEVGEPAAVFRTVPKGIDKRRGISMEPTAKQFFQFALFRGFDRYFHLFPEMGINLEDQDTSRELCRRGSSTTEYSTIDLSSASDTVSWQLVQELLRDLPDLLTYVRLVRTKYVQIDGERLEMSKYAPMGSSLCFPFECIVFASIAEYACRIEGIPSNYRVYGDDIVIDSRAFSTCCDLLQEMHFQVNRDKSFGPYSHFLEACGMEAWYGFDVSPCRLSRRFDIVKLCQCHSKSPQQVEGAIEMVNRLYSYGLTHARRHLLTRLLRFYPELPFSVNPELGIFSPNPNNDHLKHRWNKQYQRSEILVTIFESRTATGDNSIRLLRTLEKASDSEELDRYLYEGGFRPIIENEQLRCGPTRSSLRKEWRSQWDYL